MIDSVFKYVLLVLCLFQKLRPLTMRDNFEQWLLIHVILLLLLLVVVVEVVLVHVGGMGLCIHILLLFLLLFHVYLFTVFY